MQWAAVQPSLLRERAVQWAAVQPSLLREREQCSGLRYSLVC